jgi:uncharacterized membrane protein (UPF0127 family)
LDYGWTVLGSIFGRGPDSGLNPKSKIQNPKSFLVAGLLLAAACGAAPKASVTPSATPGARAVLPSGRTYSLEVARTPEEQAQGLMFRESLPEKTGMLFPFTDKRIHYFWMKNTMIPLDMVWMDAEGRVIFVSANTPPCKADPCPNYGPDSPAASVLEIAGGNAAKEGVSVGAVLRFENVK